jgi:hypothetical protein
MRSSSDRPFRLVSIVILGFVLAVAGIDSAGQADAIRIWRVGSPHRGDTPPTTVPGSLRREARRRGWELALDSFAPEGFARRFRDAVTRNEAPDLIVFDNHGIMDGITTVRGVFEGIGEDPIVRRRFIRTTGSFDDLLGPSRGWTYLFTASPNHERARTLAHRPPDCSRGASGPKADAELAEIVPTIARAYLTGDSSSLARYADPDAIVFNTQPREHVRVQAVQSCGVWGNDTLAIATVNASHEGEITTGHARVVLVLRKPSQQWQLLTAARDPVSNDAFLKEASSLAGLLSARNAAEAFPASATALAPSPGGFPPPAANQRFGTFTWTASASDNVIAEIAEFAYHGDARLFLRPTFPSAEGRLSTGSLWSTRSEWTWRIWSVSRSGDIAFSEVRTFIH